MPIGPGPMAICQVIFDSLIAFKFFIYCISTLIKAISGTPYDHFGQKASPYGELALILLVIVLWITSIMLCMNKYKKLRSLEPMIPAYNSGPSHIEDSTIISNKN